MRNIVMCGDEFLNPFSMVNAYPLSIRNPVQNFIVLDPPDEDVRSSLSETFSCSFDPPRGRISKNHYLMIIYIV